MQSTGWAFRYREGVIDAGEILIVRGQGKSQAERDPRSASSDYRETARRLVLAGSAHTPIYVSDDMQRELIDQEPLSASRVDVAAGRLHVDIDDVPGVPGSMTRLLWRAPGYFC